VEKELTSQSQDLWCEMNKEILNGELKILKPRQKLLKNFKISLFASYLLSTILVYEQYTEMFKNVKDIYSMTTRPLVSASQMLSKRLKQVTVNDMQIVNCMFYHAFLFFYQLIAEFTILWRFLMFFPYYKQCTHLHFKEYIYSLL